MQIPLLAGFRVLDYTTGDASLCGRLLADMGADVIKAEPMTGDPGRNHPPYDSQAIGHDRSLYWSFLNLNKRGITLNIDHRRGRELFEALLGTVDVLIESFPPGYLASMGLGHEAQMQKFPKLVITSVSWFGQTGPFADLPMTDITSLAMSGHISGQGYPDRPPNRISIDQAMLLAAGEATTGTCMALMARERFGFGQHVDVAVHDVLVELFSRAALARWQTEKSHLHRHGDQAMASLGLTARRSVFRCADGYINFQILGGVNSHFVQNLADWMTECGWHSNVTEIDWMAYEYGVLDGQQLAAAEAEFEEFFTTKTTEELLRESLKRKLMILPILTPAQVLALEPLVESGYLVPQPLHAAGSADGGTVSALGPYLFSSHLSWQPGSRAPGLGEHNDEVYGRELGLTADDVASACELGAV